MQLLDELSMIYTTCVLFFVVFSHGQSKHRKVLLLLCIITLAIFITGYYHYIKDPLFHQNMFALLTIIVVFRSMYVMDKTLRPRSIGSRNAEDQDRMVRLNKEILRNMWTMIACGISSIAIGFLIWNLDNIYCSSLRRWRRELGLPWGILLEGHGWWWVIIIKKLLLKLMPYQGTYLLVLLRIWISLMDSGCTIAVTAGRVRSTWCGHRYLDPYPL